MDILKFLFHFFIYFPIIYSSSEDYCQNSWCSDNNILIHFPFQVEVESYQQSYCGYPGFKLTCTNDTKTVLTLPYSGQFYVRQINYLKQQIQLYDPHNCLPNRLLNLNLSGSPFVTEYLTNYTLLSCSTPNLGSKFIPIDCLSNSTHFVSAILSENFPISLPLSCFVIRDLSVPVGKSYPEILSEDLQLTWSSPNCRYCELQDDKMCGFVNKNSDQVSCFSNPQTEKKRIKESSMKPDQGSSKGSVLIARIIILSIGGAGMICGIGIACLTHFNRRTRTISAEPAITRLRMGLDESTIESFEKIVLGESRRMPGVKNNDGNGTGCCTICLSEYNNMDVIRCIPECKHCFHAHCIDEWLRINATCPICRNSPSPSHSLFHSSS